MPIKRVLIVYHFIAHYRIPIFSLLSKSKNPYYEIVSGLSSDIDIKKADPSLGAIDVEAGGLRWIKLKNIWFLKHCLWQRGLLKLILNSKHDTIIFIGTMYFVSTWFGAILAKILKKKVVFWTHGFLKEEKGIKGFVRSSFYRLADEILVYGNRAKNILVSKNHDPDIIHLIFNSLNFERQVKIRESPVLFDYSLSFNNPRLPVIGFIGRVTKSKRLELLFDSLSLLHSRGYFCNLLIVGDGEALNLAKEKVISLGLGNYVHFFGPCYEEEINFSLLRRMRVVVSPGEVGLTCIHAMTYGVPVITHNNFELQGPEFECIIPNITGDFFNFYDPVNSLAEILVKWLVRNDMENVKNDCFNIIEKYYNPLVQKRIFDSVV